MFLSHSVHPTQGTHEEYIFSYSCHPENLKINYLTMGVTHRWYTPCPEGLCTLVPALFPSHPCESCNQKKIALRHAERFLYAVMIANSAIKV
jgi:hypothetical protein